MTRHPLRDLSGTGTCTWALQFANGRYVLNPNGYSVTDSISNAHVWLDEQRALEWAIKTPWASTALTVRARP